jgi:predicted acetyltransferase
VIRVVDLVALDGLAHNALLHYLLSHDLAARIIIPASEDAPLPALVDEPALIDEPQGAYIGMALRLVDVSAALRARPAGPGSDGITVNMRIKDATAPWNEGTWSWTSTDGKIDVSPTSAPPDVAIDAANLGPIYNGFMSTDTASGAGLIDASTPASCSRLQALLGTTSRPFCNDDF